MDEIKDSLFESEESDKSLSAAIFLITGTCIGAGMLALPYATSGAGFYPSLLTSFLCWLFMLCTGLLFLEATLWLPDGANVLSIAEKFLGAPGKYLGGATFIFLYYCLLVSYLDEGAPLFAMILKGATGLALPEIVLTLLFTFIFATMVLWGTKLVSHVNWFLVACLGISYGFILLAGSDDVRVVHLERHQWNLWLLSAPTFFSAFGYHNIIPTLSTYLNRNAKKLRIAVIVGSLIPFIVYSLWQWLVIGTIPPDQLLHAQENNIRSYELLELVTGNTWIGALGAYFAFFALITSLLGISLSMVDFLGDGFGAKRSGKSRAGLCCLVFIPPLLFTLYNPGIFVTAIGIAGGFGEAILNGLFPIAMVWVGRYYMNLKSEISLPGGRVLLTVLALFTFLIIGLEINNLTR
jgi:tyrosine-specific transport protein